MYLEVKNLVKHYDSAYPIIKDLTFSIKKGELISFLGESGSGKTTLLNIIGGLDSPTEGQVSVLGHALNDTSHGERARLRRKHMGFIFQSYNLLPVYTVFENVELPLILNKIHRDERRSMVEPLIREPELLLLDEPFSNLDTAIKETMREEIFKIIKKTKTTTILVTHDIKDALNISDRILIFKAGILQQYDEPVKMYCEPANCYCAEILGDMNKLFVKNETYYVRPEKVKVVNKKSKYKVLVEKCFFQGKEYKIKGRREKETWHFFSSKPLKEQEGVYVEFGKEDLIYFDPVCKNFFK